MTDRQKDIIDEVYEYFYDRADADHDGERYLPNKEMRLMVDLLEKFPFVKEV